MTGLIMKYFVLKPSGTDAYARASRRAMFAYSTAILEENQELSRQLFDWATREKEKVDFPGEPPR